MICFISSNWKLHRSNLIRASVKLTFGPENLGYMVRTAFFPRGTGQQWHVDLWWKHFGGVWFAKDCTPIWRYSPGPRWFPIIKGYSRFQLTACLTENEDARIHSAKKIIIIITIFMIQRFCFWNVCTYLEFYHSRSRWFSGWKDHQGYFCRPGGAIRPPMANSCLCMPLASDTRMLSPQKITYNLFDG